MASGDSGSEPPSCAPGGDGLTNCGAHLERCCASLLVCGGTYYRGYYNARGEGATYERDPATVSSFRLDKYLVTVGRFRQFVNAWKAGYEPPAGSGKHTHLNGGLGLANNGDPGTYETGWVTADNANVAPTDTNLATDFAGPPTWTPTVATQETLPITCVNWWEAYAFCIWDGGFLPSEAEWEYAAAGGSEQRQYPWGTADPGTDNQYGIFGCYYPGNVACTGLANIAPVGKAALGAGRWGQLDLLGEVFEWNLDWCNLVLSQTTYADPCVDCGYLTASSIRVMRGGDYASALITPASPLLPPDRFDGPPGYRGISGFRCARIP